MAASDAADSGAVDEDTSPFRVLPSVGSLLADPKLRRTTTLADDALVAFLQQELAQERGAIAAGRRRSKREIRQALVASLARMERSRLSPALNATGVVIHTNLGRAPVSPSTAAAMAAAAAAAVALEVEPETGRRGGRMDEVAALMRLLIGAEATLVVNNNAAAILLVLSALCASREVVVARGEAVEIGGGFRIPDVLLQSGARMVEVGTTNRTYPRDYLDAVTDDTAAFLKVHPSNFRLTGFVRSADVHELAPLARERGILVIEDLGSGALLDTTAFGLAKEPRLGESLSAGAAVVTASGDKLLGGPQAGIICGETALIGRIERHPLARAVRADKTCLAGLAATLRHYARGEATTEIPIWRMIASSVDDLQARASLVLPRLESIGLPVVAVSTTATIGGGSLPGETPPSCGLALGGGGTTAGGEWAERFARRLRTGDPPVYGRIEDQRLVLDLRTVLPEDDQRLAEAVLAAARVPDGPDGSA